MRKIHIGDKVYEYNIGKGGTAKVRFPDGHSASFEVTELNGMTSDTYDDEKHDGGGRITPSMIKAAVERYLEGYMNNFPYAREQRDQDREKREAVQRGKTRKLKMGYYSVA